ncbi:MAG: hypothetical protein PHO57_11760 [Acidithiobacillus sp.]|nr:hypothetical protein [Acidithiobacillus sp.]
MAKMRLFLHSLLALGLAALSSCAQAEDLPLWPLPESLGERPLAKEMRLNGVPVNMAIFGGRMSVDEFRRAMERSCKAESGSFQAMAFGMKQLWSCIHEPYSQTAQWQQVGNHIEGELSTLRMDAHAEPHPLPVALPDGTALQSDLETLDPGGQEGRVLVLQSGLSVAQLRAWFLRQAQAHGWKVADALSTTSTRLSLARAGGSLDFAFPAHAGMGTQVVLVWQKRK